MHQSQLIRLSGWGALLAAAVLLTGCQTEHNGHGIIYGCDGSGAGVVIRWGRTARQGMTDAGFKGIMQAYRWQTGAGFAVDHLSSPDYKRNVAKGLADKVARHHERYPDDPIYLGGLSAGCAVVLYALEELPANVSVDQVVLLSNSASAGFDLGRALPHVRGRIYNCTSDRDAVLRDLAANFGTADGKQVGTAIAGLIGLGGGRYGDKVQNIAWRPEFAKYGHNGGHTDVVAAAFVARYVAPLFVPARPRTQAAAVASTR